MNRTLRNALFSSLTALLLLGGAELTLRALDLPAQGIYAGNLRGLWWLREDLAPTELPFPEGGGSFTVRTNHLGFRGPEPSPGAVLCLGDSTTFGWGVAEGEAWPAAFAALSGRAAVNGGVPGYSTHQGLARLEHALRARPAVVVLAYLVRDVERSARGPDHRLPYSPDLRLLRLLRRIGSTGLAQAAPGDFRVPPPQYRQNLDAMIAAVRAAGAEPVLLEFPMLEAHPDHRAVLEALGAEQRLLQPRLDRSHFFAEDPIHLNPAGHQALARFVAERL